MAEVSAATWRTLRSPVVSLGNWVVDNAPSGLRRWAIDTFGTHDKTAVLIAVVVAVIAAAAAVGQVSRLLPWGRLAAPANGGVLFVAGCSLVLQRPGAGWHEVVPMAIAAISGAATFDALGRLAGAGDERVAPADTSRRLFVAAATAAVLAAALGATSVGLQRRFVRTVERVRGWLPAPARPLRAPPPDPVAHLADATSLFTPNSRFYRVDTALTVPTVAVDDWQLRVGGRVDRELSMSYAELLALPLVEADITLACVSNEVGGPLVGNARWIGIDLRELLDRAGVDSSADEVMGRSVDGFTAGFPLAALDDRQALVAVGMNGEVLSLVHGFPARLVVPGLYGYTSATKWLAAIDLTRFDAEVGYWIPRGWARDGPVKTQSRIDRPRGGAIDAGAYVVAGVAWAPTRGVDQVEVQVDRGPWQVANLGPSLGADVWRQWWLEWRAEPGAHEIRCRATDGAGETQTQHESDLAPDGATGWHVRRVTVT